MSNTPPSLLTRERGITCFRLFTLPLFIWHVFFPLICTLFILTTPHRTTLYAAEVPITRQFFIYIPLFIYIANEVAQSARWSMHDLFLFGGLGGSETLSFTQHLDSSFLLLYSDTYMILIGESEKQTLLNNKSVRAYPQWRAIATANDVYNDLIQL